MMPPPGATLPMSMTSLPLVSLLRDRLQWHQARQQVLAENVANANTPGFKPRDLRPQETGAAALSASSSGVTIDRTDPFHLAGGVSSVATDPKGATRFETKPSGNAVHLEDEMTKVAENQSDYQLAASLYQKSLAMLRSAAGVRGG